MTTLEERQAAGEAVAKEIIETMGPWRWLVSQAMLGAYLAVAYQRGVMAGLREASEIYRPPT